MLVLFEKPFVRSICRPPLPARERFRLLFEGVIGKELTNPIPDWAEHRTEDMVVPYHVAIGMDEPSPDPGEEYQHTNTQLFNVLDEANRFKDATGDGGALQCAGSRPGADHGRLRH